MSIWSHVNGVIRYNRIQSMDYESEMRGERPWPEYKYLHELESLPKPTGSEGPLEAKLWVNPETSHLAAGHIVIWGVLRNFDHDDCKVIEEYFEDLTLYQSTRDAVLTYYTEFKDNQIVLTHDMGEYDKKTKRFKEKIMKTTIGRTK